MMHGSMEVWRGGSSEGSHLFDRTVGHQHLNEKWWKEFSHQGQLGDDDSQGICVNGLAQSSSGVFFAVQL